MGRFLAELDALPDNQKWITLHRWMKESPQALYKELRSERPVLVLPECTIVSRFSDCTTVLRQFDIFTVALYKPKQGTYWMAQDDTAQHWREKSIMRSIMDFEDLPAIRQFVATRAAKAVSEADGTMDVVSDLSRKIPVQLVQDFFGFDGVSEQELLSWSFWNQYDAFHNQPFNASEVKDPQQVVKHREQASQELAAYLGGLLQRRGAALKAGQDLSDPASRLMKLSLSGAVNFDMQRVARNVGGLLIGTVETTSNTVVNAIDTLLSREEMHDTLHKLALKEDTTEFDQYVFEALRFNPAFPYLFRQCEQPVVLSEGTSFAREIKPGTIVLALTGSAMFDEHIFSDGDRFVPGRSETNTFHFGYGMHECLGIHIGKVMVPEIVRQLFRQKSLRANGAVEYKEGPFPEHFPVKWYHQDSLDCEGVECASDFS